MLEAYTGAFARYLRTGAVAGLRDFCAEGADLSRLRVYRNGFLRACIEALRASYPTVERLTGEARFPALARPWVEAHPPRVASLVEYGDGFPRYLADTRDEHRLDSLASFAALDRAWTEVYFSEDDDAEAPPAAGDRAVTSGGHSCPEEGLGPMGRAAMEPDGREAAQTDGGIPADADALMELRGRLSPRVRLVSLEHRVLDAWRRLREGEPGRRVEVRRVSQHALIWRSGPEMLHRELTPPEHAFIAGVAAGRPCGEAAAAALDVDAGFDLVATFAALLHHRMLCFEP